MGDQQQSRRIPGQQPASDQPDPGPGGISDAEYQEFLEFKKFQEWKRGERAADPTGPRPTATGTGHPVVASAEPREHWAWCYPDQALLLPAQR